MLDVNKIRNDFPMLRDDSLIYLDNGATTFKPQVVIDAMNNYYNHYTSNAHRGDYSLALKVDQNYENVRNIVASFINCDKDEVVFTSGATYGLNLIAQGYGGKFLQKGDVIVTTYEEHASNILPYFKLAKEKGIEIRYIDFDQNGRITVENFQKVMDEKVKMVAISHVSNVLGYINPIKEICQIAHKYNAVVAVDGAQSVPHIKVDVRDLDCDFLAFSAHKLCGPTSSGVMYGKKQLLDKMDPLLLGGDSNARFYSDGSYVLKNPPYKFEAGTQNIEATIAMGAAINYLMNIKMENIMEYEHYLKSYLVEKMKKLDNIIMYNSQTDSGIVSFNVKSIFAQDVTSYLAKHNICLRSGNHCAKLLVNYLNSSATVRASLYFYNTVEEIDRFIEVLSSITLEKCIDSALF